jgi:hypothetical protein
MSLLDTAPLIVTPNGYKEGKLYSVIPSDGSGDMSVVRATTATRVNSAGLVELVPYNFAQYSQDFTNGVWGVAGYGNLATIVANDTIAPDGTMTASEATFTAAGTQGRLVQSITTTNGAEYTASFYVKYGNKTTINFYSDAAVFGTFVTFNFTSNTITNSNNTYGSSVENVGNGWYRISFKTFAPSSTAQFGMITFGGEDGFVYLWGAQLVEGSTAKDYQKTETRLNIPRLDYSNGTCPSLLVEPQRTNLVTYSSSFDNAAWVKLNGSVTANIAISPSGIQDADSFIPNTTSGFHALRSNNFNQSSTASHSWFLKANGYSKIAVRESDLPIGNYASFDLSTGTLISTSQSGIIEDYGNGWYRCTLVDTNTGAGAQTSIFVLPDNYTTGDPLIAWSGDGIKGVFAYGAQAELGSYPTSYIPTTSASVTRNADELRKANASALIGQTEGTLFGEMYTNPIGNESMLAWVRNSTAGLYSNFIFVGINPSGQARVQIVNGGVVQAEILSVNPLSIGWHKFAVAYKANDFSFYVDGEFIGNDTNGSVPTAMNELFLDQYIDGGIRNASKKSFALWQTRLDNATLATLTTL